jgi:hypothetical protein
MFQSVVPFATMYASSNDCHRERASLAGLLSLAAEIPLFEQHCCSSGKARIGFCTILVGRMHSGLYDYRIGQWTDLML